MTEDQRARACKDTRALLTSRRPLDFYPTPPDVVEALKVHTQGLIDFECEAVLDPMAGRGDLLTALRPSQALAIEINPLFLSYLEKVADRVVIADALETAWDLAHVVANPAFSLLDQVWPLCCRHAHMHRRFCAVLHPVAWWSAEKRAGYIEPDLIIQLGWRPTFHAKDGPAHKGSQDFAWSVLFPEPTMSTQWIRAPKPR